MIDAGKGIPVVRGTAFVTTNETLDVGLIHVHGFSEPITITIKGIKDRKTNQYREFQVDVAAPPEMHARMSRVKPDLKRIIVPRMEN